MLDGISLDQLRTFIAATENGSFSAAGRSLGRAQSVISQAIADLEAQLGVKLFIREGRYPILSTQGNSLLSQARAVIQSVDSLKASARQLSSGLEPELSITLDAMLSGPNLLAVLSAFAERFPNTSLNLSVEGLGTVAQSIVDKQSGLGFMGPWKPMPGIIKTEYVLTVPLVAVTAPEFPLANLGRPVSEIELAQHTHLVLTSRWEPDSPIARRFAGHRVWRISDMGAKISFLRAGLGWGYMPEPAVSKDLQNGILVQLELQQLPRSPTVPIHAVYRNDMPPGPAGRWLIEQVRLLGNGNNSPAPEVDCG